MKQHLSELFDVGEAVELEPGDFEVIKVDWVKQEEDYARLVEWASHPENLAKRGKAISKGKTGKKRKPFSDEWKKKIAEATKKRWAEGKMAKRKTQPRGPKGQFISKK